MALDTQNGCLYVVNYGSDNVSVINTTSEQVVTSIPVGLEPLGIGFLSFSDDLYVGNENSATVSVINGSTNVVNQSIPLSGNPGIVAVNQVNRTVYVSYGEGVALVDGETNRVVASILTKWATDGLAADDEDNYLYVGTGNRSVDVVNGSNSKIVASVLVGGLPAGIAIDASINTVYAASGAEDNLSEINMTTNQVVRTLPVGGNPYGVVVNQSSGMVYVANAASDNLTVINSSTSVAAGSISVGADPTVLLLDPNNGLLYVSNYDSDNVSIVSLGRGTSNGLTSVAVSPPSASLSVNGSQRVTATPTCSGTCPPTVIYAWSLNDSLGKLSSTTGTSTTFTAGSSAGSVELTVMATLNGTIRQATANITITKPTPTLSSIVVSPADSSVGFDNSTSLTASPDCTGGPCPAGTTYSWSLRTVSLGNLSAGSGPNATFTAGDIAGSEIVYATGRLNGIQQTGLAVLNITKGAVPLLEGLTLTPSGSVEVQVGKTQTFSTTVSCSVTPCPSGVFYTWALTSALGKLSSNSTPSVTFTAGSEAGATNITVEARLNEGTKVALAVITVTTSAVPVITGVTFVPASPTVSAGETKGISVNVTCTQGGCTSGVGYVWSMNNTLGSLSSLSGSSNEFTAGDSAGSVTLTVNATFNGKTVTNSTTITITKASPTPGNSTSPGFLGLPGDEGLLVIGLLVAVVGTVLLVVFLRRRKGPFEPRVPPLA